MGRQKKRAPNRTEMYAFWKNAKNEFFFWKKRKFFKFSSEILLLKEGSELCYKHQKTILTWKEIFTINFWQNLVWIKKNHFPPLFSRCENCPLLEDSSLYGTPLTFMVIKIPIFCCFLMFLFFFCYSFENNCFLGWIELDYWLYNVFIN